MTQTTDYSIADHAQHMRRLLDGKGQETVVTCGDLLGQAPIDDERFILLTRNFISKHRGLGLRTSDIDREMANRRRAERAARKSAAIALSSSPADNLTDLYIWIAECFSAWGVQVTAAGALVHPEFNAIGAQNALVVLNSQRPSGLAFKDNAIRAGFERVVANLRLERLDEIRENLSSHHLTMPVEHVHSLFGDVIRMGMDDTSPWTVEEAVKIVLKTIWQVKRKMHGLPVTRHLMAVFTGPQGGGKSAMVDSLASPIEELKVSVDLKTITDERVITMFESYIGVCDELDKAERASVESLKRIITEKLMDRRVMRSNGSVKVQQNLTFVGTSNRDIAESIVDETGNRRFVSIPITAARQQTDNPFWDLVNGFSWLDLWRSVDPEDADPTADIWSKIQAVQSGERSLSSIELWLQEAKKEPCNAIFRDWSSTTDLYRDFRTWEDEFSPRGETSFGWWTKAFARMARHQIVPFALHRKAEANGYEYTGGDAWLGRTPVLPIPDPGDASAVIAYRAANMAEIKARVERNQKRTGR